MSGSAEFAAVDGRHTSQLLPLTLLPFGRQNSLPEYGPSFTCRSLTKKGSFCEGGSQNNSPPSPIPFRTFVTPCIGITLPARLTG